MSVCLESNSSSQVAPPPPPPPPSSSEGKNDDDSATTSAMPTKVNTNSVITLVNAPITIMKGFGGGGGATTTSTTTITLLNTTSPATNEHSSVAPINNDKQQAAMNVFVKKCAQAEGGGISTPDMPQSHKLLTANSFPPTNVLQKLPVTVSKSPNGQRAASRMKIVGHMLKTGSDEVQSVAAAAGPSSNVVLNRQARFFHSAQLHAKQIVGNNGVSKFVSSKSSPLEADNNECATSTSNIGKQTYKFEAFGKKSVVVDRDAEMQNRELLLHHHHQQQQQRADAVSFVCHSVLLDHNYNATLPPDPPSKPTPPPVPPPPPVPTTPPANGAPYPMFSPGRESQNAAVSKRTRTSSQSAPPDEDAASDISETKADTEGEETDTAPEAEAVASEANDRYGDYVTRCICGFIHDDGFMIECDKCKVWQHVRCVVKTKKVPDDYSCEECDPRTVDKQKARSLQQQWMREIQERDAKLRKEQMARSESDSSDTEAAAAKNQSTRRKEPQRRQRRDSTTTNRAKAAKRKERKVPMKRAVKAKPTAKSAAKEEDEKLTQLRQWIENYEEAVTNHYSPELRARISSVRLNGAHSEIAGGVDPSVNKCRVQSAPSNSYKCLIASVSLPMGTPVIELRGKYMLSIQHRSTTRQQRPGGPFLFFHTLVKDTEVCVDTRTYGNCARFVRRSCTPNAKLQHVLEKGALHLYIVTTKSVEKGSELTIRHENHDIAGFASDVPCACINSEYCAMLKGHRRHNGDAVPCTTPLDGRKRRRRQSNKEALTSPHPPSPSDAIVSPENESEECMQDVDMKKEVIDTAATLTSSEIKVEVKEEMIKDEPETSEPMHDDDEVQKVTPKNIVTRRYSRQSQEQQQPVESDDKKPMSREERKMAAIVKAIERLEKQEQRQKENQAKQATRREPDQQQQHKDDVQKAKRRKRKGRARTSSTNSRRNRLDSADSVHSSDDTLLSPPAESATSNKAAGMLLALANGENRAKSPDRSQDSSNSAHSSPETPLSTACLMVAAAVEPLEPGFKFPKTKKVLMNEWLNKSDVVQPASAISPSSLTPHIDGGNSTLFVSSPTKCATFCDQSRSGSAKKRWLRQAISEDQCDSPPQADTVAPPKKRRLPRESLSCESSPPTTPTAVSAPNVDAEQERDDGQDEDAVVVHPPEADRTSLADGQEEEEEEDDSSLDVPPRECTPPPPVLEETIETRVISMVTAPLEEASRSSQQPTLPQPPPPTLSATRAILDPRLAPRISTSELVGTVEKTLSYLGYEDKKQADASTPAKRKLSINEYRQRKKLNNNEKSLSSTDDVASMTEESNSQSPKLVTTPSHSSSSVTSPTTSDDEQIPVLTPAPVEVKALSAFNSEPTELERQRESATLRLKRALGLSMDNQAKNSAALNVETILKSELTSTPSKPPLSSPNFPIPGSVDVALRSVTTSEQPSSPHQADEEPQKGVNVDIDENTQDCDDIEMKAMPTYPMEERKVLYYTPDDEEGAIDVTYVPPFNNPLYPNANFASYGSVIDDDAPYEGRNPSPPPDLGPE